MYHPTQQSMQYLAITFFAIVPNKIKSQRHIEKSISEFFRHELQVIALHTPMFLLTLTSDIDANR